MHKLAIENEKPENLMYKIEHSEKIAVCWWNDCLILFIKH